MICPKCGSETTMQVQAVISAPGELAHQLSKQNLRRKDVQLLGVLWETADYVCTNWACAHVVTGYGNYVTKLEKENERLKAELSALKNYETVRWEYRWKDTSPYTVTSGKWSEWMPVEPRNPNTVEDRIAEIQHYVDDGGQYEIRALYTYPIPSMPCPHELWAAAQLVPGEGIEDGVERIENLLAAAKEQQ